MHIYVNKDGIEVQPFYPQNTNNNLRRFCSINNGQGRNNMVVADFGNRLYLRRIITATKDVVQIDDILSVPTSSVSNLY